MCDVKKRNLFRKYKKRNLFKKYKLYCYEQKEIYDIFFHLLFAWPGGSGGFEVWLGHRNVKASIGHGNVKAWDH